MLVGWKRNLQMNQSEDEALKQQWLDRGKQLFRTSCPAVPDKIHSVGAQAGADSQDEDAGYEKGARKKLQFLMPYWLSFVAEEMFLQAWRCRKGRDKENDMEVYKGPVQDDRRCVPPDSKYQWMVEDVYKVPEEHDQAQPLAVSQAVVANELNELPNLFKKYDLDSHLGQGHAMRG